MPGLKKNRCIVVPVCLFCSLQQGKFSESIETMLTKLEEFCGLVDMVSTCVDLIGCRACTFVVILCCVSSHSHMFDFNSHLTLYLATFLTNDNFYNILFSSQKTRLSPEMIIKAKQNFGQI